MSNQLFIALPATRADDGGFLPAASLSVSWLSWDTANQRALQRGSVSGDALGQLAETYADVPCYAIVPGETVSWHQLVLPKGGSAGQAALPFQMEERLCADLEELHLSHSNIRANLPVNVLATEREQLRRWWHLLSGTGLRVQSLLPDYAVIPDNVIVIDRERASVHAGNLAAAMDTVNFGSWWRFAKNGAEDRELRVFCDADAANDSSLPDGEHALFEQRLDALATVWQPWLPSLLCGEFALSDERSHALARWRWPLAMAVILGALSFLNLGLEVAAQSKQIEQLDAAIDQVYLDTFPGARVVNARSQMRSQLNALTAVNETESRFFPLLQDVAQASQSQPGLQLEQLNFDANPGQLKLSVRATDYAQVDRWIATLKSRGLDIERGAFGESGDGQALVSGQLTIRRGQP